MPNSPNCHRSSFICVQGAPTLLTRNPSHLANFARQLEVLVIIFRFGLHVVEDLRVSHERLGHLAHLFVQAAALLHQLNLVGDRMLDGCTHTTSVQQFYPQRISPFQRSSISSILLVTARLMAAHNQSHPRDFILSGPPAPSISSILLVTTCLMAAH